MAAKSLLVVGAATRDVDPTDSRGWRLGGTVAYTALAAARFGINVWALIGADHEAASAPELHALSAAGVVVSVAPLRQGPIFDNRETPAGRAQFAVQASDPISVVALPRAWTSADAVVLGPVGGEIGDEWAGIFSADTHVALGWQGLLRSLVPGRPVSKRPMSRTPLVARANSLLISAEDVPREAPAVSDLLRDGQELAVTHGRRGAIRLRVIGGRVEASYIPPVEPRPAVDTTGAGDVFLGAWMAARLASGDARQGTRSLTVAAAMASLTVGRSGGVTRVPPRTELCELLVTLRRADRAGG